MMKRRRTESALPIKKQIKQHFEEQPVKKKKKLEGNMETMISTGSTLLDLATSGGRVRGGGIPGGIMVVAYGPSGSGKTVLACEITGYIQRQGGDVKYRDSEARLDKDFAKKFDLNYKLIDHERPNTISECFRPLHKWKDLKEGVINGYIVDSLAALSTDIEMDNDDGDKMGMRRAKEFSEHLRKGARLVTDRNLILFCTNQIREKADAQKFERKDVNPGGKAIEFYASLVYRFTNVKKIWEEVKIKGKEVKRAIGMETVIEIDKSSIWKPYRSAPMTIMFDYGIDDIRENLKYIKNYSGLAYYSLNGEKLSNSLDTAIEMIEERGAEDELKEEVIDLWEEIEAKFEKNRKKKKR